ncbi:MAG: hypothetical protein IJF08_00860 [Clostridia bacterium]|nr:hypothetical protein [Clostridia bacterium]
MKNRRIILIAFLLCSCMIVGLGYAAYSEVLDISGTAELDQDETHDGNVYFSSATPANNLDTASIVENNPDKATFSINSISHVDQYATFTFTITNENDEPYDVAVRAYTNNADADEYYSITCDIGGGEVGDTAVLPAHGTLDVLVTVEMTQLTPANTVVSATFLLELLVSETVAAE